MACNRWRRTKPSYFVQWNAVTTAALGIAIMSLLLTPAIYNGFPLVFSDLNGYLSVSYGHSWTVDRSGFYGLFLKPVLLPMSGVAGMWLAATIQAALVTAVLLMILRRLAPRLAPAGAFAIIAVIALFSSLPWHVSQLMPDTFTGPLILLTWLAASRDPAAAGSPLLWLATALLTLLHYTHIVLVIVVAAVTLALAAGFGVHIRQIGRRALAAVAVIACVMGAQIAANGAFLGRWSVSPLGSWFLLARLNEDGLLPRWLDRHCGRDAPRQLCSIRSKLPHNSQQLLWSYNSPFYPYIQRGLGKPQFWHWVDMINEAVEGTIRDEPVAFAKSVAEGGVRQFFHFQAVDDLCDDTCKITVLISARPDAAPALLNSRQLLGKLPKTTVRSITTPVKSSRIAPPHSIPGCGLAPEGQRCDRPTCGDRRLSRRQCGNYRRSVGGKRPLPK